MDISNIIREINLDVFTKEQKRAAILMWVAYKIKFRLKDYNMRNAPTGYSTRLWAAGRGSKGKTSMPNRIQENIELQTFSAKNSEEVNEILKEISDEIIENSIIVTEDLLRAARNAKTAIVRNKYLKAINNPEYLKTAFVISVLYYAKQLIGMGQDLNHTFLTIRVQGIDVKRRELNNVWKEYAQSEKDKEAYEEAINKTEAILISYEKEATVNIEKLDELATEKFIYAAIGEKNTETLIDGMIDKLRERLTGEIKLFPVV